jgi:hypothetical protein
MVKYDKELAEILQGRELSDLSVDEVNAIQKQQDEIRMQKLDSYLADGTITQFDYDYLHPYCENTMAPYKELYDAICRSRGQKPRVYYKNIDTGEVDRENLYLIQHIAPFTSMVLEFHDDNGQPLYVSLGKLKSVERIIEKIGPNSNYARKYEAKCREVVRRYQGHIDDPRCRQQLAAIPRPVENVNDILRCTTICNRFKDVRGTFMLMEKDPYVFVNPSEIKDKHKGNILPVNPEQRLAFSDNPRNHRDFKFIGHLPGGFKAEFMAMTAVYEKYYKMTHKSYEVYRTLETEINGFPEPEKMTREQYIAKKQKELKLFQIQEDIRKVSGAGFERENIEVLKDVRIMEDQFRYEGKKPQKDGTYPECRDYIRDNFYVRTVQALDSNTFSYVSDQLYDVFERYLPEIKRKYLADIRDVENRYSMKGVDGAYLDAHYLAADNDEYEVLRAMDDGHVKLPRRSFKAFPAREEEAGRIYLNPQSVAKDNKKVAKSAGNINMFTYIATQNKRLKY